MSMAMGSSKLPVQRSRSLFDLPPDFFDSCSVLSDTIQYSFSPSCALLPTEDLVDRENEGGEEEEAEVKMADARWSCNICKDEFESLQEQRSHFKSDLHRLNIKLSIAGKRIIKEEEFNAFASESFKDFDVSSISGSEDEVKNGPWTRKESLVKAQDGIRKKLYIRLKTGDIVSVWKSLVFDESDDKCVQNNSRNEEFIEKMKYLIREPRNKTVLRIILLASGGHFAGCIFDGSSILAHKTFHRYVVRAKSGKKQSTRDATGKAANSAGASLRRHNELSLKKEIHELFDAWKHYFGISQCIFIYAPSHNRQLFFDGEKAYFNSQKSKVRHVPFTVRRPTLNEAKRIYNLLTNVNYEVDEMGNLSSMASDLLIDEHKDGPNHQELSNKPLTNSSICEEDLVAVPVPKSSIDLGMPAENEVTSKHTPLHEAAGCGDAHRTLELLELGMDPCIKDERGRTPYLLATEKEVRNTFRRFMALNLDKWDWHAANVPSPLTKEMEESQAAKQAEKDAKRKAKSKEMKKLRREKEKARAQAASVQTSAESLHGQGLAKASVSREQSHSGSRSFTDTEEELKKAQAAEREKRAAAAERRIAALNASAPTSSSISSNHLSQASELKCSCCIASLSGIVPFHRYNYKYCSTSCMHVHREMLEDG